jgi:hypothetical protein
MNNMNPSNDPLVIEKLPTESGQNAKKDNSPTTRKRSKKKKRLTIIALTTAGVLGGGGVAVAFDLGGLSGLLDTFAPVLSQYTGMDITKYAGYLTTFQSVMGAVKTGSMNGILSAVGSINKSLGDSGVVIPSKLASDVLDTVTAKYATDGKSTTGVGFTNASDRALAHAQNVSHRAYVESVLGEEGQKNIKAGVQGSGDLVKSASDIASKGIKATISQKKLDAIIGGQVILTAGNAQTYGKLTEIQINGAQQTEIQSGILEYLTHDKTSKTLGSTLTQNGSSQAAGVFAGLAAPAPTQAEVASSSQGGGTASSNTQATGDLGQYNKYYNPISGTVQNPAVTNALTPTDTGVPKF